MMGTQISPMLAVSDPDAAIDFYKRAFGAEELWRIGQPAEVAGLSIGGARLFLARENPPATRSPDSAGHTTVRIELFDDDPQGVHDRAMAAGARNGSRVEERTHQTIGPRTTLRMLQGSVIDPFGHVWLIGKFLG
ncbi:MAG: VOC family protein [Dehalococcoidia bacterium]